MSYQNRNLPEIKMNKNLPEIIFEIANTHNGNLKKLKRSIDEILSIKYKKKAIKFQIFSPDGIATPEFKWYKVYKEITFSKNIWNLVLKYTKGLKIYLDIFDSFGVDILSSNINRVHGIKLQASVLDNFEINSLFEKLNLKNKKLILNISGYDLKYIDKKIKFYQKIFKEVIIQIGFQNYPTKIEDLGYSKLKTIRKIFPKNKISLADHISYKDEKSIIIPAIAIFWGVSIMEKHFCASRKNTKYDFHSSLTKFESHKLVNLIQELNKLDLHKNFILKNEKKYLDSTKQVVVAKKFLNQSKLISLNDLTYKRSSKEGLNVYEIKNLQKKYFILKNDIDKNNIISKKDFKKAKIGILVACRLKSKRLENKALLKIGNKKSIEHCLNFCLKSKLANITILATSSLKEDDALQKIKMKNIKIFRGEPDDVVKRFIDCSKKFKIDIIVRVTGDCPFVSPEIIDVLIQSHFEKGADFTYAEKFSIGTSVEIINLESLKTVFNYKKFNISEYMSFYFKNNPHIFNLNKVLLPKNLIRNYRLTLDYKDDLKMFSKLIKKLKSNKKKLNIKNIFSTLDEHKSISKINLRSSVIYVEDKKFVRELNYKSQI